MKIIKLVLGNTDALTAASGATQGVEQKTNPTDKLVDASVGTRETQSGEPSMFDDITAQSAAVVAEQKATDNAVTAELLKMMAQVIKDNNKGTHELVASVKDMISGGDGNSVFSGKVNYSLATVPKDDMLEQPALFFSYSAGTHIYDDMRNGFPVNIPIRPVKFKPFLRTTTGTGRGALTKTMCVANVVSESQAKFIREHSLFGIKYFENQQGARNVSEVENEALIEAYNQVSTMNEFTIKQRCIQEGISVESLDIKSLKTKLAKVISKRKLTSRKRLLESSSFGAVSSDGINFKRDDELITKHIAKNTY